MKLKYYIVLLIVFIVISTNSVNATPPYPSYPITSEYQITSSNYLTVTNTTSSHGLGGYVTFTTTGTTQDISGWNTMGDELWHFTSIVSRPILRYPITVNDFWDDYGNSNGYPVISHSTVESNYEVVTVPAGTFNNVVKTSIWLEFPNGYDQQYYDDIVEVWYAPDVGFIKIKAHDNGTGDFYIGELTNFSVTSIGSTFNPDYFPMDIGNTWIFEWNQVSSNGTTASLTYSATVTSGQNTIIESSNSLFGPISRGKSKTLNDSVVLNNTGIISAKVEARFIDNIAGAFGLVSDSGDLLNATNFALGVSGAFVQLNNNGGNVQVTNVPPGITGLDARLSIPSDQSLGDYSGTVILTFSDFV